MTWVLRKLNWDQQLCDTLVDGGWTQVLAWLSGWLSPKMPNFTTDKDIKDGYLCSDPHGEFVGKNVLVDLSQATLGEEEALSKARKKLHSSRSKRPRPHLDDKASYALYKDSSASRDCTIYQFASVKILCSMVYYTRNSTPDEAIPIHHCICRDDHNLNKFLPYFSALSYLHLKISLNLTGKNTKSGMCIKAKICWFVIGKKAVYVLSITLDHRCVQTLRPQSDLFWKLMHSLGYWWWYRHICVSSEFSKPVIQLIQDLHAYLVMI